jgi:L-asparaginase
VAADPNARGRGVLVVLNDEIHSARDVRKMDNNRVDTFASSEWGALGVVDADGVVFRRSVVTAHTTGSELAGVPSGPLPPVAIVADYAGHDGSALRAAVDAGARGVVVQAFGGGRASPGMREAIATAAGQGVPVVLASRVPEGRVLSSTGDEARGIATAGDLPPHKARVLLMLALRTSSDVERVQHLLDTH